MHRYVVIQIQNPASHVDVHTQRTPTTYHVHRNVDSTWTRGRKTDNGIRSGNGGPYGCVYPVVVENFKNL